MKYEIQITDVREIVTKTGYSDREGLMTKLDIVCKMSPSDIARLHHMQKSGVHIYLSLGTEQAMMDLNITPVLSGRAVEAYVQGLPPE